MVGALLAQEGPLRPRAVPAQEHPQARRRERVVPGGYEALEDPHQNVGDEEHPPEARDTPGHRPEPPRPPELPIPHSY